MENHVIGPVIGRDDRYLRIPVYCKKTNRIVLQRFGYVTICDQCGEVIKSDSQMSESPAAMSG